ncbi:MAG: NYN domain-containing protein, partial [Acidimicrobiales bacterium]
MKSEHIVVDGSNIATEGRSYPSLSQLEAAVSELRREYPQAEITVIVDATFAHRIDAFELERFDAAELKGEYVHPPAGAVGRGDAFLLRVAEKVDAIVLSNDSFQEFHGEHPWLFDRGRLIGATPVQGIGWIFSPRTPVRGPASRRAVRDSGAAKRQVSKAIAVATKEAIAPATQPPKAGRSRAPSVGDAAKTPGSHSVKASKGSDGAGARARGPVRGANGGGALATGAGSGARPSAASSVPARTRPSASPSSVNDPLTFIAFIADHPLGAEVEGEVESYTSHGAVVMVGSAQCYLPLANMAEPAPRAAREVVKRHEHRAFVVTALDPQRRGVELALPGIGAVSGRPRDETIEAEVRLARRKGSLPKAAPEAAPEAAPAKARKVTPAATTGAVSKPVKEAGPTGKAATGKAVTTKKVAPAKKAPPSKAPAKSASPSKAPPSKAPAQSLTAKSATAKSVGAKKTARAQSAPAKRSATTKKALPREG